MAKPTATRTCPRCSRSYPEDQFLSDNRARTLKLCFPCRNSSRVSHKKRRDKLGAEARKQEGESSDLKCRHEPGTTATPASPSPLQKLAAAAMATATPAPEVSSPRRLFAQFLSESGIAADCPSSETPAGFNDAEVGKREAAAPTPVKKRRVESTIERSVPTSVPERANVEVAHEHLLSMFISHNNNNHTRDMQTPELDVGGAGAGDAMSLETPFTSPIVKQEQLMSSAARNERDSTEPLGTPSPELDTSAQVEEEGVEHVHRYLVCRFHVYASRV